MLDEASKAIGVAARPHRFGFEPSTTALLIIDVQNDFCHPAGFCAELGWDVALLRTIIAPLQNVLGWARATGLKVLWTKEAHRPDLSDLTPSKKLRYENAGCAVGVVGRRGRFLIQGEWGAQIINELRPRADEMQVDKPAQSVFPGTDIETLLRDSGITHLLFAGVTTECCVLASYRQASDLGFFCLLLEDCCAAFESRDHQAAIDVLTAENGAVGWVASSSFASD